MVPVAIEGCTQGAEGGGARGGSISLALLIDFIVQRTYDELTVLAELLPRKTDMERKIEIYKFSARTRQLFVRLLALVKWASSATKVDRSAHIMAFLDKQALLFVETADVLARVARETLVHARLPTFHMAAAVEVLTLGTYSRLPAVIRERLVPPPPLTPGERRSTLRALAHIVRQRLTTASLPSDVRNLKVENGRATFTVGQEFSVSLTVMGDAPNLPWRLLDIAILIQDNETGEGKPLVHTSQLAWLRGVAQARLAAAGLGGALTALRYFCRSLSLELLYTQTLRLCRDRLSRHLQVDKYIPGHKLQVSYWRELGCELGYRLIIGAEGESLCVWHVPALAGGERVATALTPHAPSMERLLAHTVHVRSRQRLNDLKVLLTDLGVECSVGGWPCVLACSALWPCLRAEQLLVSAGAHAGRLRARVPAYPHAPRMQDLAAALALSNVPQIKALLTQLRFWLVARRCEKTLQHLPASACEHLPFLHGPEHPLNKLSPDRLYVTLHRHTDHILIVEMKEVAAGSTATTSNSANSGSACSVALSFHLAGARRCTPDECEDESSATAAAAVAAAGTPSTARAFLKLHSLVELDTFTLTHGPFTPLDTPGMQPGKRKLCGSSSSARAVRVRQPAYFLPELAHVVAAADERVPFVNLAQELAARGVTHGGVQPEWSGAALGMRAVALPRPAGAAPAAHAALRARLLAATVRLTTKNQARVWTAEIVFHGSPVRTPNPKEQGERRCVYLQYELGTDAGRTADAFLADWAAIVHLHTLLHDFMQRPAQERETLWQGVCIRSYTYRSLVLGFGPSQRATAVLQWSAAAQRYTLATPAHQPAANAHHLLHHHLDHYINWHKDLMSLGVVLRETYAPLLALSRLPALPQLGLHHVRTLMPTPTFTLLAHSWRKIRIIYAGAYSLEVGIRGGGVVTIRDGSYSKFDRNTVVDEFAPAQGLKTFLSRYVEETLSTRLLAEDDNPPSPMSPMPPGGLRFPAPMTPPQPHTPHSAPLTPHPASPAQHQMGAGSFNLTSPPGASGGAGVGVGGAGGAGAGVSASPASPMAPSPLAAPAASPHPPPTSPFTTWPASPSLPRPSPGHHPSPRHHLDHKGGASQAGGAGGAGCAAGGRGGRAWAGASATPLAVSKLEALCTPGDPPPAAPPGPPLAPLQRFLACVYMKRTLQRFVQQEDYLTMVSADATSLAFRCDSAALSARVFLNPQHMQSLHLQLTPLPDLKEQWTTDDLQVIEKFFEQRVAIAPYRATALQGWARAWGAPGAALPSLVALMRAELAPPAPALWALQWALRIPPAAPQIVPAGQPAVLLAKHKILFFICLTRGDTQLVLPLVYDMQLNVTQLADKRDSQPHLIAVSLHLKRFSEFNQSHSECTLWPAVRDLLTNFTLPQEAPQPPAPPPP
ncbi:mediator of RNA polymerase II transcription subunit 14 [Achroia grisella]|uniref:mediator of RNA polymerase II transcription subunit 14 n=1 Tax=Achroia grisella TaxID=688607 RepID=UPI0027D228B0|nr:mediator of RNA polymerase II transcription subunit 14 [Achroia grisella]